MALTLVTSDLIHGLDYSKLTGTIPTWNQNTTGNAATATLAAGATILANTRNINGVAFNGSTNITIADSTKLPLAGGTLTGTLGGTSATFSGIVTGSKLVSLDGILELDDNGTHNGIINSPASLRINIDSDNGNTGESFVVGNNQTAINNSNVLFKVQEDGNVGIGTDDPSSLLSLGNAIDAQKLLLYDDSNFFKYGFGIQSGELRQFFPNSATAKMTFGTISDSDGTTYSPKLTILSGGNVGIGTASNSSYPIAPQLVLDTGTSNGGITIKSGSSNYSGVYFADGTTGNEQYRGFIQYNHNFSGGVDEMLFGTAGSTKLTISSGGDVTLNSATALDFQVADFAQIKFRESGAIMIDSDNNQSSRNFSIKDGGGDTLMTILDGGNVGIGTTSPTNTAWGTSTQLTIEETSSAVSSYAVLNLFDSGGTATKYSMGVGNTYFYMAYDNIANAHRMVINNNGYVGIGTTSPTTALTISKAIASAAYGQQASMIEFKSYFPGYDVETVKSAIYSGVSSTPSLNTQGGFLAFHVNNNGTMGEKLRIDKTGSVGIGNSNPSAFNTLSGNHLVIGDGSQANNLTLYSSSASQLNGYGHVAFADTNTSGSTAQYAGLIQYYHGDDSMQFYTNSSIKMRITSGGNVLIGKTATNVNVNGWDFTPAGLLTGVCNFSNTNEMIVLNQRDGSGTTKVDFRNGNSSRGSISWTTSGTNYGSNSDYRLKENVTPVTDALSRVNQLKPSRFNFIADADNTVDGFIAHEVQDIIPEAITGEKDALNEDGTPDYQGIDQSKIVPLLTAAIQEQQTQIELLKQEVELLKQ